MPLLTRLTAPVLGFPPQAAPGRSGSLTPAARGGALRTRVANVAHRGASSYAPENTLAAVREGIALGCDLVEVDLHRTRDGALVALHDATLTRTTDVERVFPRRGSYRVSSFTLDELRRLDAGSWKSPHHAGERVPTLAQVVETLRATGTGLLLEVKTPQQYPGIEVDLAAELYSVPGYVAAAAASGRLVVQSFDHAAMRVFKEQLPQVPVGLLGAPPRHRLGELATWADEVNPRHRAVRAGYVRAVQRAGLRCQVWTVDGVADMRRAIAMGVDGVITNRPHVLAQVLEDRSAGAAYPVDVDPAALPA